MNHSNQNAVLADLTIKGSLAGAAGNAPIPGGEGISALNGAIAAALTEMVARLTVGKRKYAEVERQMKTIVTEVTMIRERSTGHIDKDSEAYDRVSSAFKLPGETPGEQVIHTNAIQSATREVAIVPMRMAEEISSVMKTIIYITHKGNQNVVANACVAMMAACTCVLGALLNARINLTSIQDKVFVGKIREKADKLEANAIRVEQRLLDWVKTKL